MKKTSLFILTLLFISWISIAGGDHAHDSSELEAIQMTQWTENLEVFIEHEPFVPEKDIELIVHVTHLDGWKPKTSGPLVLIFSVDDETPFEVRAEAPVRPGVYLPKVNFPHGGTWQLDIPLASAGHEDQSLTFFNIKVHRNEHDAQHAGDHGNDNAISFLKEQQWHMDFDSAEVSEKLFRESLPAFGTIVSRADGETVLHAPISGRLIAPGNIFPSFGTQVSQGQKLGAIVPKLDQANDPATLNLAVTQAELALDFAKKDLERLTRLFSQEAVPQNRVRQAELQVQQTTADLKAARQRVRQLTASQKGSQRNLNGLDLYAPLSGNVIQSYVFPGSLVQEGDPLFQIADLSRMWLQVNIPEANIHRVTQASGAWFTVDGLDKVFEIHGEHGGKRIALGGQIDPQKRTVPLIFEVPNPQGHLRKGMFAKVSVLTGKEGHGLSVPASAIIEEAGLPCVYVHVQGETFERRTIKPGIRDGNDVQILAGLKAGERVVTKGAYQVRLAGSSDVVPDHGHTH